MAAYVADQTAGQCCAPRALGLRCLAGVVQIRAAAQLWDGTGTLLFTGSAGLFTVDDGSQCNEDSPVAPLGVSERNDRCSQLGPVCCWVNHADVHGCLLLSKQVAVLLPLAPVCNTGT